MENIDRSQCELVAPLGRLDVRNTIGDISRADSRHAGGEEKTSSFFFSTDKWANATRDRSYVARALCSLARALGNFKNIYFRTVERERARERRASNLTRRAASHAPPMFRRLQIGCGRFSTRKTILSPRVNFGSSRLSPFLPAARPLSRLTAGNSDAGSYVENRRVNCRRKISGRTALFVYRGGASMPLPNFSPGASLALDPSLCLFAFTRIIPLDENERILANIIPERYSSLPGQCLSNALLFFFFSLYSTSH